MVAPARETETRTLWTFDQQFSQIGFSVRHMNIAVVRGQFAVMQGTIVGDLEEPTLSEISLEIDAGSLTTCNEQRDGHLRTADFLDVEHYPTITFISKSIRDEQPGSFAVTGDLTLHGVTREVILEGRITGVVTSPFGDHVTGLSAEMTIDRRDFGIDLNMPMASGEWALANEVRIEAEIEAVDRGAVSCPICHPKS